MPVASFRLPVSSHSASGQSQSGAAVGAAAPSVGRRHRREPPDAKPRRTNALGAGTGDRLLRGANLETPFHSVLR